MVQVAHTTGQEPPKFEDHTLYSNQGMEDLLKLNEVASAIKTETIKAHTPLVLMGTSMNVVMEPLHRTDKALPQGLHVHPSYGTFNCGSQRMTVQLYNTKDHAIIIKKGTAVARMVAVNEVPEMGRWAKEGCVKLTFGERRKILFNRLELSNLKSWIEENKERALNLLAEYHNIFALEDGEMGCTEATEHEIEVTDPKPFKERPRNIPSGLLEEVKDHLDHMLDVGVIKPSKLAWSNAVVLVQKNDRGFRFCINF